MLYRDTHVSRQLAGERHAELKQEWCPDDTAAPALVERRSGKRFRMTWLRTHLRSAASASARHAS